MATRLKLFLPHKGERKSFVPSFIPPEAVKYKWLLFSHLIKLPGVFLPQAIIVNRLFSASCILRGKQGSGASHGKRAADMCMPSLLGGAGDEGVEYMR
jgi:hypothetical protein